MRERLMSILCQCCTCTMRENYGDYFCDDVKEQAERLIKCGVILPKFQVGQTVFKQDYRILREYADIQKRRADIAERALYIKLRFDPKRGEEFKRLIAEATAEIDDEKGAQI